MKIDNIIKDLNLPQNKIDEIKSLSIRKSDDHRLKDRTGEKSGRLTILGLGDRKNGRNYWWAICSCKEHNIIQIRSDAKTQSCGCIVKERIKLVGQQAAKDLTNKRFHKLIALYPLEKRQNGKILWHCKCDCGKEIDVASSSLINENTKSCGCIKKETSYFVKNKSNLVGQKFGHLLVLEETNQRQYEKVVWKCQCDCGRIVYLNTTTLKNGNNTSCGCAKESLGVFYIKEILKNNNIFYTTEYNIKELGNMKFDFAIYDENKKLIKFIEYDGEQHYKPTGGWNSKKNVQETQKRDQEKNQWAKENNIPLVRIPYWERDNITLDMILGDKYLVC